MEQLLKRNNYVLLIGLVFTMPFSLGEIKLNSYIIILFSANSILFYFTSNKAARRSFSSILVFFILAYVIHLFGLFNTDNFHEATFELQKKASVLIFPLLLFISPRLAFKEVKTIMLCFLVSCILAGVFCIVVATCRYFLFLDSSFFFYHGLSSIVGIHATYLSMYFCFSIAILLYIYFNDVRNFSLRNKFIYYSSLSILTLLILLLGTRTQLFLLVIGTIIYFSYHFNQSRSLFKSISAGIIIGFFILCAVFLFPTNQERLKEAFNYDIGIRWGEKQVRYLIWSSALELIRMHPIMGVGTGDVQDELQRYYLEHEYISLTYLASTRYNAHNQFLETAIGLGFFGLLILLLSFFVSLRYAIKQRKILYLIFTLIFMISCFTESMLERQNGIVFYTFFNSFLYFNCLNKNEETFSVVV